MHRDRLPLFLRPFRPTITSSHTAEDFLSFGNSPALPKITKASELRQPCFCAPRNMNLNQFWKQPFSRCRQYHCPNAR
jgi:hypothetical protein